MFGTVYAGTGRMLHFLVSPLLRRIQFADRVRIAAINENREILLVRSWFGHQKWSLPGGGIGTNESATHSAARELQEETGILIHEKDLRELGKFSNTDSAGNFKALCFVVVVKKQNIQIKKVRKLEIIESGWFSLAELPDTSENIPKILQAIARSD